MKIDKKKITDALAYRKLINDTPFDEIDWSEFPTFNKIAKEEIENFKYTGLCNVDFILYVLDEYSDV